MVRWAIRRRARFGSLILKPETSKSRRSASREEVSSQRHVQVVLEALNQFGPVLDLKSPSFPTTSPAKARKIAVLASKVGEINAELFPFALECASSKVVTTLPVTAIGRMAFALDRKILYVTSGTQTLLAIDPDALTIKASYVFKEAGAFSGDLAGALYGGHGLPITSNNRIWFTGSQWAKLNYFDVATSTFGAESLIEYSAYHSPLDLYDGNLVASADGSRMAVSQPGLSSALPTYLYTAASGETAQWVLPNVYSYASMSPNGSMIAIGNSLYALPAMTLIGTMPDPSPSIYSSPSANAFSPRGTRLYVPIYDPIHYSGSNSTPITQFNVYDTTKLVNGSTTLVLLGSIPVNSTITSCTSINVCQHPALEIDPIGTTLVIAGTQGVSTVSIPPQFRDPP